MRQIDLPKNLRPRSPAVEEPRLMVDAPSRDDYARAAAVFRYRSSESEALIAVRLSHIRALIDAVQQVLAGLNSPVMAWVDAQGANVEQLLGSIGNMTATDDPERNLLQHHHLTEYVLETALHAVRTSANGGHDPTQICSTERRMKQKPASAGRAECET